MFSLLPSNKMPLVMGILNVTPDSFSDGGKFQSVEAALNHALQMQQEGVDIIDVGGESTRPGADPVSTQEEIDRVLPVIQAIRRETDIPISVDTSSPELMLEASKHQIQLINDVRALQKPGALQAAQQTGLPVCLMHMQGDPKTMQQRPAYDDLVQEVLAFFRERIEACVEVGMSKEQICLDPGFGFGKTPEQNLSLIHRLETFRVLDCPLLVGLSRKSTMARVLEDDTADRLIPSVVGAVVAVKNGATIVRVHDVAETIAGLRMLQAIETESLPVGHN